jgi:transposase InsO family protein
VIDELGLIHAKSRRASPWQNAFIERSHRTDNEECFELIEFESPEDRRLQHRLWEMEYNCHRPHQGIGGRTPMEVYRQDYRLHAASRMLM